jgi:hypothetical protein
MEWLKKERSKREKSSKPSVENVAVERKVTWEVAELPQLGVVVKFFPPTKPRCVYKNALMHNDREIEKITEAYAYDITWRTLPTVCMRYQDRAMVRVVSSLTQKKNGVSTGL